MRQTRKRSLRSHKLLQRHREKHEIQEKLSWTHPSNIRSGFCCTASCNTFFVTALRGAIDARSSGNIDMCCQKGNL